MENIIKNIQCYEEKQIKAKVIKTIGQKPQRRNHFETSPGPFETTVEGRNATSNYIKQLSTSFKYEIYFFR